MTLRGRYVAVAVDVDVIAPVIVAALVSGNDTVEVIDTVDIKIDQLHHHHHDAFEQPDS